MPDRSPYPQYRTHVAWAHMLIDAAARGLRQASARQPSHGLKHHPVTSSLF